MSFNLFTVEHSYVETKPRPNGMPKPRHTRGSELMLAVKAGTYVRPSTASARSGPASARPGSASARPGSATVRFGGGEPGASARPMSARP